MAMAADVAQIDVAPAVALAGEGQHGVGPGVHRPVDRAREVHAEEREAGVGHRVDEVRARGSAAPGPAPAYSPRKRKDPGRRVVAGGRGRPGPRPARRSWPPGPPAPRPALDRDRSPARRRRAPRARCRGAPTAVTGRPRATIPPCRAPRRRGPGTRRGSRRPRWPARGARPRPRRGARARPARSGRAGGPRCRWPRARSASASRRSATSSVGGDDDLAAPVPGDVVAVAELDQLGPARGAQLGLARARRVVEAGVDHPRVVAALVGGDRRLLVQHHAPARRVEPPARRGRWPGRRSPRRRRRGPPTGAARRRSSGSPWRARGPGARSGAAGARSMVAHGPPPDPADGARRRPRAPGRCHNARRDHPEAGLDRRVHRASTSTGRPAPGSCASAPKILVDGATLLARSLTYRFASFERQVGGASSGINATPDARAAAVAAFVTEVEPRVGAGEVLLQAGRGVTADELAPLRAVDPRPAAYWDTEADLTALGIAVAAEAAAGGLDGRAVAIEGFDAGGAALARAVAERGGRVVAVVTAVGHRGVAGGVRPRRPRHGVGRPRGRSRRRRSTARPVRPGPCSAPTSDVLVAGSRPGVIDDRVAAGLVATVVVPGGPVPVTAKGLAVARRSGRMVLPDFVSTAGPLFAWLAGRRRRRSGGRRGHGHRRRGVPRSWTTRTGRCSAPATGPRRICRPGGTSCPFGRP